MSGDIKFLLAGGEGAVYLGRDAFSEAVFNRDKNKCVCCGETAADAHHIIERKLFHDGGYYLGNGASVCPEHHMQAEMTHISVEDLRRLSGITRPVIPANMSASEIVDKWGNPILKDGRRMRGPMFYEEQVQKILARAGLLDIFQKYFKYPRTYHLAASPGASADDKILRSTSALSGKRVISTKKMDGENTTLYQDYMHARSIDGRSHPSRDRIKRFHSTIRHDIPEDWRVCGENMTAVHSIRYDDLRSHFLGFSIWDEYNVCRPWDETLEWFELIGIEPVEVVYDGIFDEDHIVALSQEVIRSGGEGTVTRVADAISYADFPEQFCKFVRAGHVQTDDHWMDGAFEENGLSGEAAFKF